MPAFLNADDGIVPLKPVLLGQSLRDHGRREDSIQDLVHRYPSLIPMDAIEPAFSRLVPICRELEIGSRSGENSIYLDNLWLTPDGGIVLGECKLARNSQSRREVLVQAIDYASRMQGWHYEDLQNAVRKTLRDPALSLWDKVRTSLELVEQEDGEARFINAIERRLANGQFIVLIIADAIAEGLEGLKRFLDLNAGFHATIAFVELSFWQDTNGRLLVIPRVPLKTLQVVRGVMAIGQDGSIRVGPPPASGDMSSAPQLPKPYSLSEDEFYSTIEARVPGVSSGLRSFLNSLIEDGISPEFRRSAILRWQPTAEEQASAGYIDTYGAVHLGDAYGSAKRLGKPEAGRTYLETLAVLVGGSVHWLKDGQEAFGVRRLDKKPVQLSDLLPHAEAWKAAIAMLVQALRPDD